MVSKFKYPDFSNGELELRFENNIICLYGTRDGLKKLSDMCLELIEDPNQGHIHIEDYNNLLTKNSLKGVVAIFDKE